MTALYEDDVFSPSSSRFQTKKAPQRKTMNGRKSSSASLRGTSLAQSLEGETGNGVSSLAYELATALAVEGGSGGSRGLAEELGFEYDEGAEGIDHSASAPSGEPDGLPTTLNSLEDAFGGVPHESHAEPVDDADDEPPADLDPAFETPTKPARQARVPEQDPMTTLEEDLESTERFLSQLRRLDVEPSGRPVLEGLASDVIRRLDDTTREREGQVRELLEYERQFRRIAGEVGGNDALGQLDAIDNLIEEPKPRQERDETEDLRRDSLDAIQEESMQTSTSDWEAELDRDRAQLEEEPDEFDAPLDPKTLPAPPPIAGPPTPAATTVQLAHFRTVTATIATSLATISEQTQVNTAGATEAGRKIRALKNKLGEWRSDWESAERSRVKIERWEAGVVDSGDGPLVLLSPPGTPTRSTRSRVDGRKIVQAQLDAFAQTLSDATVRIQTIMAAVP